MKKAIFRVTFLAILAVAGWYGYRYVKARPQRASDVATAKVQRGDVVIRAYTRGELKAVRTYQLYAPNLNGTVQVTKLAPMGALAREKNLVVEYDDSELLAAIEADQLNLDTTDENIKSQKLSMDIRASKDKVDLLSAQFAVERAKLNLQKKDVLDVITAKKNQLQYDQAVRALEQTRVAIDMQRQQQDSQMEVYNSNRNRSLQQLRLDQNRLRDTRTLAPMTGLVAVKQNRAGNFNFGQQMPDVRVGDQVQAGMNIADLLDLSEMELSAKVGELDRANLSEGQAVAIQLDSIPDKRFPGTIKSLSGTATADVFSGDPSKKFDVTFSIDMRTLLTGLGMSPAKVDEIMKTAETNRERNLVSFAPSMGGGGRGGRGGGGGFGGGGFGGGEMRGGGGFPGGFGGFPGGGMDLEAMAAMAQAEGAGRGQAPGRGQGGQAAEGRQGGENGQARGQGRGGFGNMSDEDRQKMRDLRQKLQGATGDEATKIQAELTALMEKAGISGRGGFGGRGGQPGQPGQTGQPGQGGAMAMGRGARGGADGQGFSGRGGRGGDQAGNRGGGPGRAPSFTEEERKNAVLPPPPEQDEDVTELLRPGLLADVEIQVEKIPNALHVPLQAIFRADGKPVVYVKQANGKFLPREVKLVKQSESMMVLAGGVQEGETVALSDPTAAKSQKETSSDTKKSSGAALPGGVGK